MDDNTFREKVNKEWMGRLTKNLAMIADSEAFLSMLNGKLDDPLMAMQFSIALFLDKPIHIIADTDTKIPNNIRKVAASIQVVDYDDKEAMLAAVKKITDDGGL